MVPGAQHGGQRRPRRRLLEIGVPRQPAVRARQVRTCCTCRKKKPACFRLTLVVFCRRRGGGWRAAAVLRSVTTWAFLSGLAHHPTLNVREACCVYPCRRRARQPARNSLLQKGELPVQASAWILRFAMLVPPQSARSPLEPLLCDCACGSLPFCSFFPARTKRVWAVLLTLFFSVGTTLLSPVTPSPAVLKS